MARRGTSDETLARGIASWVQDVEYGRVPEEVRRAARKALINSVGTGIGGFGLDDVQRALAYGVSEGPGPATVLVDGRRLAPSAAAFVNGVMFTTLGQEETHFATQTHPSETTAPVVLTVAELYDRSGTDVIEAILVGIEVTVAVASMALTPAVKYEKCEAPAVYGTIGAAAAAAKLIGLGEEATAHALGLAANFAAGLSQCFRVEGTDEYHFIVALASVHAYMAAQLALRGATAAQRSLEGDSGFYRLFANVPSDALRAHDVVSDVCGRLVHEWTTPELIYKPYPVYYFNQVFADGASMLRREHYIQPTEIRSIRVEVGKLASNSGALLLPPYENRASVLGATAFCVAAIFARGRLGLADTEDVNAGDIAALLDHTEVIEDEGLDTARIAVATDADTYVFDGARQARDLRLDENEVCNIAREAANNALRTEEVEALLDALVTFERVERIKDVMPLMVANRA